MKIYKAKDYEDMSRKAANIISAQTILKPHCLLGLATGGTPEGICKELVEWYNKGDVDFSGVKSVVLDELKGLDQSHDQSSAYYLNEKLFQYINIDRKNTYFIDGLAGDSDQECARYDDIIQSLGGVDLQLLGIGTNGHIGYNEPGEAYEKEMHCVALPQSTIDGNAKFFSNPEDVPGFAYTMGLKTIMHAKKILLVASGKSKAEAIYNTICGPITPEVPASILQLHNDVIVVADEDALSKITACTAL